MLNIKFFQVYRKAANGSMAFKVILGGMFAP